MAFKTFRWWLCPECGSLGQVGPSIDRVVCSGGEREPTPRGRWDIKLDPAHEPKRCIHVDPPPGKEGAPVCR